MTALRTVVPDIIIADSISDIEFCHLIKKAARTTSQYRQRGLIPYYICLGKVRYKLSDVEKFQNGTQ